VLVVKLLRACVRACVPAFVRVRVRVRVRVGVRVRVCVRVCCVCVCVLCVRVRVALLRVSPLDPLSFFGLLWVPLPFPFRHVAHHSLITSLFSARDCIVSRHGRSKSQR
jgi:hypothetical protein